MAELKPGNKAPHSGDYDVYGKQGNLVKPNVTMDKNETLPPTPKKQQVYVPKGK